MIRAIATSSYQPAASPPLRRPEHKRGPEPGDVYQPSGPFKPGTAISFTNILKKASCLALVAGLALAGVPALAADLPTRGEMMSATGPLHPEIQPGGVKFDKSPNQLREEVANSVTREQLKAGQPAYRAADAQQKDKRYYRPELEREIQLARQGGSLTPQRLAELMTRYESSTGGQTVASGTSFRYCIAMNASNHACAGALNNQISYKLLSCQYRNQEGKHETVLQRVYEHQYTHPMQRAVCGGNRLEGKVTDGFMQWAPVQTSQEGQELYLNPQNIIASLPAH